MVNGLTLEERPSKRCRGDYAVFEDIAAFVGIWMVRLINQHITVGMPPSRLSTRRTRSSLGHANALSLWTQRFSNTPQEVPDVTWIDLEETRYLRRRFALLIKLSHFLLERQEFRVVSMFRH